MNAYFFHFPLSHFMGASALVDVKTRPHKWFWGDFEYYEVVIGVRDR